METTFSKFKNFSCHLQSTPIYSTSIYKSHISLLCTLNTFSELKLPCFLILFTAALYSYHKQNETPPPSLSLSFSLSAAYPSIRQRNGAWTFPTKLFWKTPKYYTVSIIWVKDIEVYFKVHGLCKDLWVTKECWGKYDQSVGGKCVLTRISKKVASLGDRSQCSLNAKYGENTECFNKIPQNERHFRSNVSNNID
jgi:hypothetical protein